MIKGVIFDMDGVLVDSEPVIETAAREGLAEYGVKAQPEDFLPFVGAGEDNYIGGVARQYGVAYKQEMKKRVYEIYLEIVNDRLGLFPGIGELLGSLKDRGLALALASSADHIKIDANLKAAEIEKSLFSVILGGEDAVNKKPHPEIYLTAANRLGLDPGECLVAEDALNGVEAAKSAGCYCAGISSSFSGKDLESRGADWTIGETRELAALIKKINAPS